MRAIGIAAKRKTELDSESGAGYSSGYKIRIIWKLGRLPGGLLGQGGEEMKTSFRGRPGFDPGILRPAAGDELHAGGGPGKMQIPLLPAADAQAVPGGPMGPEPAPSKIP
jgi:hypothetical protein